MVSQVSQVSSLRTREEYIADITRIKLGLANSAQSGSKGLNTIIDCLMQGSFDSFEENLRTPISPLNKENCRKIVGGMLVEKLSRAYVEKASVIFATVLKDFSCEELKVVDETLTDGRSGKAIVRWPDWERFTPHPNPKIIWDSATHEKFDTLTSESGLKTQLKAIQDEIVDMGSTLLTSEILTEMHQILTVPAPIPSSALSTLPENREGQEQQPPTQESTSDVTTAAAAGSAAPLTPQSTSASTQKLSEQVD